MDWTHLEEHASGIVAGVARGVFSSQMCESSFGGGHELAISGFDGEKALPLVVTVAKGVAEQLNRAATEGSKATPKDQEALEVLDWVLRKAGVWIDDLLCSQPEKFTGKVADKVTVHIAANATVDMAGSG